MAKTTFSGERGEFGDSEMWTFEHEGRTCRVAVPETPRGDRAWVWRARFWDAFGNVDQAMLAEGFHICHIDVTDLFGGPEAMRLWDSFYALLTERHGLASRVALEGMSRGGLPAYNWSARRPECVACIYTDAPVCDIRSWPAQSQERAELWPKCLAAYGLTDETVADFTGSPIENLAPLAEASIPILTVLGELDEAVVPADNTDRLAERYRALGGSIELIRKPECGHHPHGLDDPTPIVQFLLAHTA